MTIFLGSKTMKRQLKKLATSLMGASVLGTCLLGASAATGSVSSSAIASESVTQTESVELARGLNYELLARLPNHIPRKVVE